MGVLFIFIDGLGLGPDDREINPLAAASTRWFRLAGSLPAPGVDGRVVVATDATLGVPGLPQSATGQTALLTGKNAPFLAGRHINGYCTRRLAELLEAHSLFGRLRAADRRAAFANAYTPRFFQDKARLRFPSVTTVAQRKAGMALRTLEDLARGEALHQELTNTLLRAQGYDLPLLSPAQAGARLAALAANYDFTMFEFFQTDLCGHAQDFPRALRLLEDLDGFLTGVLDGTDLRRDLVVVGSDHGNLEDLSRKTHTANPVPTMAWGAGAHPFASRIRTIADLAPAILDHLGVAPAGALANPPEND
ncbi:MAG: hypothetical protein AABZ75_01070 [candidate division NC10 bacterium]